MAVTRYKVTVDGKPLAESLLGLLSRLEVRESDAEATVAALRFVLAQRPNGEFSPLDDDVFHPLSALSVALAAPGGTLEHVFAGYVTHVRPHFEELPAACYVEVLAMDAAVLLDAEERVASYPDATDAEAAERIFGRYGIPLSSESTTARYEERRQLLVQRGTDWDFIRQLARRNGYCCYLEPNPLSGKVTAYFRRRALAGAPQPDLALLRDESNLAWLDLQLVGTGPTRWAGASIDPIAKRLLRTEGTATSKPMGRELVASEVEDGLSAARGGEPLRLLREPPPLDTALQASGTGATEAARLAVEARGEVDCGRYRGLLRARRPVLIKGVGRAFAGTYYVRTVRTTLEGSALTQSFVALRNAMELTGREPFGRSFGGGA
jgi:phage protein D